MHPVRPPELGEPVGALEKITAQAATQDLIACGDEGERVRHRGRIVEFVRETKCFSGVECSGLDVSPLHQKGRVVGLDRLPLVRAFSLGERTVD